MTVNTLRRLFATLDVIIEICEDFFCYLVGGNCHVSIIDQQTVELVTQFPNSGQEYGVWLLNNNGWLRNTKYPDKVAKVQVLSLHLQPILRCA